MNTPKAAGETLVELERLKGGPLDAGCVAAAWRLVTAAQRQPDFFAALDFALEGGFVVPCGAGDPKRHPNPTWVNPLDGSEMVWIPPGRCRLGPDAVAVELAGFSLARHPVTNDQFELYLADSLYTPHGDDAAEQNGEFLEHWAGGHPPAGGADHPVVFVSYLDALAYCEWAGLSVPGEYQWEKAARGTDGRAYPWGNAAPRSGPRGAKRPVAQFDIGSTAAVGSLPGTRSPYGCEQMAGNVSTWCQPGDPTKPGEFPPVRPEVTPPTAAVRGGAFKRAGPRTLRACHRRNLSVVRRNDWVGIRPACLLPVRPADPAG